MRPFIGFQLVALSEVVRLESWSIVLARTHAEKQVAQLVESVIRPDAPEEYPGGYSRQESELYLSSDPHGAASTVQDARVEKVDTVLGGCIPVL